MTTTHRFDPLNAQEIRTAVAVTRAQGGLDETAWFETVSVDENRYSTVRRAYVCCYEPSSNRTFAGFVDLAAEKLHDWRHMEGQQARIVSDEFEVAMAKAQKDPRMIAALEKRGITDMSKVLVESWAAGNFGIAEEEGRRLAYGHCWLSNEAGDNPLSLIHI